MTKTATFVAESQRLRALARANEVRHARAELKRRIAEGDISAAEVVRESPPEARGWPVAELLMSQPNWGRVKCRAFLSRNQIGELKAVGKLTPRQRRLVVSQLERIASCTTHSDARAAEPSVAAQR
jgi:hypothetical protein